MIALLLVTPITIVLALSLGCTARSNDEAEVANRGQALSCSKTPQAVLMQGTCGSGRPIDTEGKVTGTSRPLGNLADYTSCVAVEENPLGFARIRANAQWSAEDMRNVMGQVPSGTYLSSKTITKGIGGIGYVVAIKGSDGQTCAGYISHSVVEALLMN